MPLAAISFCVGSPVASGDHMGTLGGSPANGVALATLEGTLLGGRVQAFEASSIRTGYRVKLNGSFIADEELIEMTLKESNSTPVSFLDFTVVGESYSILRSLAAWTLVPIELYVVNGLSGFEYEELRFAGYIRPGAASESSGSGGPGVELSIAAHSKIGRFGEHELCHEIEPLSGLTRGEVMTELCADVGVTAVSFPDGAIYTKGITAQNVHLLAYLQAFIEPEGWSLRELPRSFDDGGPILEAWTPLLKETPLPPDGTWDCTRVPSFRLEPPKDIASRYVVRGYSAVFSDELGQTTKRTVWIVEDIYAPKVATHFQDGSGNITPTGLVPTSPTLRTVQRIVETRISRGEQALLLETSEEGYYNPRYAKQVTDGSNDFAFVSSHIDQDGEYVTYANERFGIVSRQRITYTYDEDRLQTGSLTQEFQWHLIPRAVAAVNDTVAGSISGSFIFGDDNSYSTVSEHYGLTTEHVETRLYNDITGAESQVTIETSGYVPVRSLVSDPTGSSWPGYYIRSDGQGQNEVTTTWRTYGRTVKRNLFVDETLSGTIDERWELDTYRMVPGTGRYQYGDFDSNYIESKLIKTHVERVGYTILSSNSYEKVSRLPGKPPRREIFSGRMPQPRYRSSAWTVLRQEPLELVVDDTVIQDLLGFRREVVNNDHVQDLVEAQRVIDNRRAEAAAYTVTLTRHESIHRVGDTILLVHPDHAVAHRALITEITTKRSRLVPSQTADYTLRVPW